MYWGKFMNYDFNDVAPWPFTITFLWPPTVSEWAAPVASSYFGVSCTCGLLLFRSELHLWPLLILEWVGLLHCLCGDTLNVQDWKFWSNRLYGPSFLGCVGVDIWARKMNLRELFTKIRFYEAHFIYDHRVCMFVSIKCIVCLWCHDSMWLMIECKVTMWKCECAA